MTVKSNPNPSEKRKFDHKENICESPQCKKSKGENGCGKVYQYKKGLKRHLNQTTRYVCDFENCGLSYSQKGGLDAHKLDKHRIPMPGTKPIPYPPGTDPDIFKFIKYKVRHCIATDKKKMNKEDLEFFNNNEQIHHLAKLLYKREIIQNKAHESLRDKLGGHLPNPLHFFMFGGIFQGSLDRIDINLNHFVNTNDPISNVQLIPLGMNNIANLSNLHMDYTVDFLNKKIKDSKTQEADCAIKFQKKKKIKVNGKRRHNTLYRSCSNSFNRDKCCKAEFKDLDVYFQYCLKLLKDQKYRCAVSDIFFENEGDRNPLQISVDAIDPRKGHVPENLRIIILALNCVSLQQCKKKKLKYPKVPHQWTRDIFRKYIGIK